MHEYIERKKIQLETLGIELAPYKMQNSLYRPPINKRSPISFLA